MYTRAMWCAVLALLGALAGLACKRAEPEAHVAIRLPALGATVDAPASWEVAPIGKDGYRIGLGPREQVFVRDLAFAPKTVDELYAAECARAPAPGTKLVTAHGALFVHCTLRSTPPDGPARELVHVAALLRSGGRGIKCHFGTVDDAEAATAVCLSLRL